MLCFDDKVAKLLLQCAPDFAVFGEKDYQQLRVVTRMAADLDLGVKVIGCKTMRERDGLAMSSRNRYLSPDQRAVAPTLQRTLRECAAGIAAGQPMDEVLGKSRAAIVAAAGYAVADISYRLAPQSIWPAQRDDVS